MFSFQKKAAILSVSLSSALCVLTRHNLRDFITLETTKEVKEVKEEEETSVVRTFDDENMSRETTPITTTTTMVPSSSSSSYGAKNSDERPSTSEKTTTTTKKTDNKRKDQWNEPGGPVDPGVLAKYNDWVRRKPWQAMVGSLGVIVALGVFESLLDDWSVLPYYGEAVILETVLSLDNIVVFHQIFESLRVPNSRRPSILLLGRTTSWSACDWRCFWCCEECCPSFGRRLLSSDCI